MKNLVSCRIMTGENGNKSGHFPKSRFDQNGTTPLGGHFSHKNHLLSIWKQKEKGDLHRGKGNGVKPFPQGCSNKSLFDSLVATDPWIDIPWNFDSFSIFSSYRIFSFSVSSEEVFWDDFWLSHWLKACSTECNQRLGK